MPTIGFFVHYVSSLVSFICLPFLWIIFIQIFPTFFTVRQLELLVCLCIQKVDENIKVD